MVWCLGCGNDLYVELDLKLVFDGGKDGGKIVYVGVVFWWEYVV